MSRTISREEALSILNVSEDADELFIKDAYRRQAKRCHPDAGGSPYLFRLVRQAYEVLTEEAAPSRKTSGKKADVSWEDIVGSKDFLVPFDKFANIVLYNETEVVEWNGHSVLVTANDVFAHYIRTEFPVVVRVKSWKNRFGYWLRRPCSGSNEAVFQCRNGGRNELVFGSSMKFLHSYRIKLEPGFHVVEVELLERKLVYKFVLKPSMEPVEREETVTIRGRRNIDVSVHSFFRLTTY